MAKDVLLQEHGWILYETTREFCQRGDVDGLAAFLLPNGYQYVTNLREGGVDYPQDLAHYVVHEWVRRNPEACFTGTLCKAMKEIGMADSALKLEERVQNAEGVPGPMLPNIPEARPRHPGPAQSINEPYLRPMLEASNVPPILVPLTPGCEQMAVYQATGKVVSVSPQTSGATSQASTLSPENDNHVQPVALNPISNSALKQREGDTSSIAQGAGDHSMDSCPQDLQYHSQQSHPEYRGSRKENEKTAGDSHRDSPSAFEQLMAELEKSTDAFDRRYGSKLSEEASQSARGVLWHFPPERSELIERVVLPIVGPYASELSKTVGGLAIVRRVLKESNNCHRKDRERLTRNGETLSMEMFRSLFFHQDNGYRDLSLRYDKDKLIRELSEQEQVEIKQLLTEKGNEGYPFWKRFLDCNQKHCASRENLGIDTCWHLIQEDYDVKKLYGHLIGAGLLEAAKTLEVDKK